MSDTYFVRTAVSLRPVDDASREAMAAFGEGEIIRVKLWRDRNPAHHRLFFALLNLVYENQDKYASPEALRFAVTCQAGWVDEIRLRGDKVALRPKSLSWGRMGQDEFNQYYQAALRVIPELLPQFEGVDLEGELRCQM